MNSEKEIPMYNQLRNWVRDYGHPDVDDPRAFGTFMDLETREAVEGIRAEIRAVAEGRYLDERMDIILGKRRKVKFGSYTEWGRMALLWMANYKPY